MGGSRRLKWGIPAALSVKSLLADIAFVVHGFDLFRRHVQLF